ncbi:Copia protein, partial [Mucuna pruriens]
MTQFIIVQIYVDDIIFRVTDESLCEEFLNYHDGRIEVLGLHINQANDGIYIHQTMYVKELLKNFNSDDMCTPMHPTSILTLYDSNKMVYQTTYKGMISSLLYLIASRPNIMFRVYLCAHFQDDPRESHLIIIKRTTKLGLWFKKSNKYRLTGYYVTDYAGDRIISTSGGKQETRHHFPLNDNIPLLCDNTIVINLSKNHILHSKAKHIEIKHHFIRDYIHKGIFDIKFINTNKQLADIFTKPLPKDKLIHIRELLDRIENLEDLVMYIILELRTWIALDWNHSRGMSSLYLDPLHLTKETGPRGTFPKRGLPSSKGYQHP